jgi:hypothetical protein
LVRVNKRIARRAGLITPIQSSQSASFAPIPQRHSPSMVRRKLEMAARRQSDNPVLSKADMDDLIKNKESAVGIGEK